MIQKTRLSIAAKLAVLLVAVACAPLLAAPIAGAAAITYQDESFSEFQQQLASGKIQEVTINRRLGTLRIALKDGSHVLAKYKRKGEPAAAAELAAKHVPVTVLTLSEAEKEAPKAVDHHKLRYIAAGILVVVILIVGGVLLFVRRGRERD
jgi:autotransporter translocation and assembly factor TamB